MGTLGGCRLGLNYCYQYPAELEHGMYFGCGQNVGRDYMVVYKHSYAASRPAQLGWAQFELSALCFPVFPVPEAA